MNVRNRERGAAAVEFALVVPVLLVLVLGIAEFGRAYNIQTTLSGAAREGARVMALDNSTSPIAAATTKTIAAAPTLGLSAGQISISPSTCVVAAGAGVPQTVTVTVTYPMTFLTTFFGSSITLTGKGVMLCNG